MSARVKPLFIEGETKHPAQTKIPVVIAKLTPADKMPGGAIVQQTNGFDVSAGDVFFQVGTILKMDNIFMDDGLLQPRKKLLWRFAVGGISGYYFDMFRKAVDIVLIG